MAKRKYVLLKAFAGLGQAGLVGQTIELTEEQANHPLYKSRVRLSDDNPKLTPATPDAAKGGKTTGAKAQE